MDTINQIVEYMVAGKQTAIAWLEKRRAWKLSRAKTSVLVRKGIACCGYEAFSVITPDGIETDLPPTAIEPNLCVALDALMEASRHRILASVAIKLRMKKKPNPKPKS